MKDYRQEILDALRKHGRVLKRDWDSGARLPHVKQLVEEGRIKIVVDDASPYPGAPRRNRSWIELRLSAAQRAAVLKLSLLDPGFEHHWGVLCDPRNFDLSPKQLQEVFDAARVGVDWHTNREVGAHLDAQTEQMGRKPLRTARRLVPAPDPDEPVIEQVIASEPDLADVQRTIDDEIQRRAAARLAVVPGAQTSLLGEPTPAREVVTECAKCGQKAYSVQQGYDLFYRRSCTNKKGETVSKWQAYCKSCIKKSAIKAIQAKRLLKKTQTTLGVES